MTKEEIEAIFLIATMQVLSAETIERLTREKRDAKRREVTQKRAGAEMNKPARWPAGGRVSKLVAATCLVSSLAWADSVIDPCAAAEEGWAQYLCRFGKDGTGRAQMVRINRAEQRVVFLPQDRDAADVKFKPGAVTFLGPTGLIWRIADDGSFYGLDRDGPMRGSCKPASD